MATQIENNTEGLQEILQLANSLPSGQKYGKLVVFGDSVGQGYDNNDYSFVDILSETGMFESVVKACVGGATIGPYGGPSGYDLNSQIERYASDVRDADMVMLEYGGNDIYSVINGSVQMGATNDDKTATTVCGYIQKALDRIYELNQTATLHWVNTIPQDWEYIKSGGDMDFADCAMLFTATALRKISVSGAYIVNAFYLCPPFISSDGIHPNNAGHKFIAKNIIQNMFSCFSVEGLTRTLTLSGDVITSTNLSLDGKFTDILALFRAGVDVRCIWLSQDGTIEYKMVGTNDYAIQFGSSINMFDATGNYTLLVTWGADGTLFSTYFDSTPKYNLLDNSYFCEPVNTRNASGSFEAWGGETIDKWSAYSSGATISFTQNGLNLQGGLYQKMTAEQFAKYNGKQVTGAAKIDGVIYWCYGTVTQTGDWHIIARADTPNGRVQVEAENNNEMYFIVENYTDALVEWAALYVGRFDYVNLPGYTPKGYATEWLACNIDKLKQLI